MKIFVYLDESGSIHKNSSTKYFAVGGYFTLERDRLKVISRYKKINLDYKIKYDIELEKEIKGRDMSSSLKKELFLNMQKIDSFYGIVKVFDKSIMRKSILNSNIFYNYAVRLILDDCILPLIGSLLKEEKIEFIISLDNRNLAVRDLCNLEDYLYMEYSRYNYTFDVTYYDSKYNYGIQLADLVVNTFYNYFTNTNRMLNVFNCLILKKFRVSSFPGGKILGRRYKIRI